MCNNIVQQYFKYVYDVTSVTMTTTEYFERTLQFPIFNFLLKVPNIRKFLERYKKKVSGGTMAMLKEAQTENSYIQISPKIFYLRGHAARC